MTSFERRRWSPVHRCILLAVAPSPATIAHSSSFLTCCYPLLAAFAHSPPFLARRRLLLSAIPCTSLSLAPRHRSHTTVAHTPLLASRHRSYIVVAGKSPSLGARVCNLVLNLGI
ncbi:uncharacterized protein J3R85_008141 [Psidium guajava]|nr:uncharacterized protein J3R85_008141 [Psidium guajava]